MSSMDNFQLAQPVVRAFARDLGIDPQAFRDGGRLTLTLDDRYTVHVWPACEGRVVLEAFLADLRDLGAHEADLLLSQVAGQALSLFRRQACGLAIDPRSEQLCLQQVLPASITKDGLSQALTQFRGWLQTWMSLLGPEPANTGLPVLAGRS